MSSLFSLFKRSEYQPIKDTLLSEEDFPISLNLKGETARTTTSQITKWNLQLTITENKEIIGSGSSLFNRKKYNFFIIGTIEDDKIKFIKSFPELKYHLKYNGTITKKKNKINNIQIFSDDSFGVLDVVN